MITTEEENKQVEYKISIATQTLERNINFITICDQKTSIALTAIGVLLTIVVTNDGLRTIRNIIIGCFDFCNFGDLIFLITLAGSFFTILYGVYKLLKVLFGQVSEKAKGLQFKSSRIFFTGINSCIDFKNYKSKFLAMNDEELLEELLEQIYINSDIAVQKYKRYNTGLKYSIGGFAVFLLLLLIGSFVY